MKKTDGYGEFSNNIVLIRTEIKNCRLTKNKRGISYFSRDFLIKLKSYSTFIY